MVKTAPAYLLHYISKNFVWFIMISDLHFMCKKNWAKFRGSRYGLKGAFSSFLTMKHNGRWVCNSIFDIIVNLTFPQHKRALIHVSLGNELAHVVTRFLLFARQEILKWSLRFSIHHSIPKLQCPIGFRTSMRNFRHSFSLPPTLTYRKSFNPL